MVKGVRRVTAKDYARYVHPRSETAPLISARSSFLPSGLGRNASEHRL